MPGLTMNCDSACIPIEKPLRKRLLNRVRLESSVVPPMPAPYLYMPMEIASRELDSRLLIALFAVQAGLEVVIGQKWLLQKNARAMPKGYWIFKTLTPGDAKQMQRIQKLGHAIAAIDEEMPGLGDGSQRLRWVDPRSVNATEAIFCLGRQHVAAMERSYPDHAHKLITTGNPRWDFLRPELRGIYAADAAAITRDYGRFLLVNTNIGLVNSAKNSPEGLIRALTGDGRINLDLPEDRAFVTDLQAFERANFAAAAPLVRRLSEAFPDRQIVLRPHPTEKLEPYQTALAGVPRAHIVREGPAAAWLSAADLLIHTSCTTATEAFALGKPAICYQTIPSPLHSYFLSSALSAIARSEDEVIAETQRILAAGSDDPAAVAERQVRFEDYFAGQSGPFAAELIARFVADATGAVALRPHKSTWKPGLLFRKKWRPTAFQRNIFPDFSADDIARRLDELAAQIGVSEPLHVRRCGDGQFHIST